MTPSRPFNHLSGSYKSLFAIPAFQSLQGKLTIHLFQLLMDQDVSVVLWWSFSAALAMRVTELPQGNKFSDLAQLRWPAYEKPI